MNKLDLPSSAKIVLKHKYSEHNPVFSLRYILLPRRKKNLGILRLIECNLLNEDMNINRIGMEQAQFIIEDDRKYNITTSIAIAALIISIISIIMQVQPQ